ncbi:MAG: tyrosine--tRNA ligase [Candidatus Lloydbacteria bacterium RIFCSPLOWO2_01_FULL_50_20]|uniref:Tyrosine--tRNA ligase n=1 Tax=Candidatus Lloydbacteria bacterium RIFCSPLOWO2_01_FULL_50_20 TaxID=1798665 RepID=A0A1G2DJ27_9BACT|nr:MAG: tyrosine--tRNA ligase [Candidatus Lloydbacteria bacterium RIFCSPLOWO2_01_FULL_50_20]
MEKNAENELIKLIDEILTRGVGEFIDPDNTFREKLLKKAKDPKSKEQIIVKFGVDPTRPDIHLGHAVVLRKLRQLQDLGCKVIFLVGDFTAQIGDPTGKSRTRPEIEQAAIEANMKTYLDQIDKILKLEPAVFSWIRNSDWFYGVSDIAPNPETKVEMEITKGKEKITLQVPHNTLAWKAEVFKNTRMQVTHLHRAQIHDITLRGFLWTLKHVTHSRLLERDLFQERIKNNSELYMHEVMYPVLQGIDSYVLDLIYGGCDLEIGGTDQTFNMLMGREVMKVNKKAPQAVLSIDLLVGLDGKEKMSKSMDNYVGITDVPNDMFGKLMSIPDALIPSYVELCTFTPVLEAGEITKKLQAGKAHPRDIKMDLAEQIVEIYHGPTKAKEARSAFVATFQNKKLPDEMPEAKVAKGTLLADVLINEDVLDSKSEFRRLMSEGAIRKDGEEKLTDPMMKITEDLVLKVGKHRFIRIVAE